MDTQQKAARSLLRLLKVISEVICYWIPQRFKHTGQMIYLMLNDCWTGCLWCSWVGFVFSCFSYILFNWGRYIDSSAAVRSQKDIVNLKGFLDFYRPTLWAKVMLSTIISRGAHWFQWAPCHGLLGGKKQLDRGLPSYDRTRTQS